MSPSATLQAAGRQKPRGWLDQASAWSIVLWAAGAAVSVFGLVLALQTALFGEPFPAHWYRYIVLLAWATLLPIPSTAWGAFQAQRSIWTARLAPSAAAKGVARSFWLTMATSLVVTFAPLSLMTVLAPPSTGAGAAVLMLAGWIGGTLGLGVMAAAAWARAIDSVVGVVPWLLALLVVPFAVSPETQWTSWQAAEGWRSALLLALAATPALGMVAVAASLARESKNISKCRAGCNTFAFASDSLIAPGD